MAYYSKYTGAELEEKLDKVEEIPQLIAQMITGKDFVTKEDLLCVLKDYAPADYHTIPIDNNTIYWENGVLKAATSSGTGQCQWELREYNGVQYLYSRFPVVTLYDVTMYANVGHLNLPSIYDGLPIDGSTLYWEETENGKILKAKISEGEGSEESVDAEWVILVINNAGFATLNWVSNLNFVNNSSLNSKLLDFVTLDTEQIIKGKKDFIEGGLFVNGGQIHYNELDKYWKLEGDLLVTGHVIMFSNDFPFTPSTIMDGIIVDDKTISKKNGYLEVIGGTSEEEVILDASYTTKGIASFNSNSFVVNDGAVDLKTKIVISKGTPSLFNTNTLYIIT